MGASFCNSVQIRVARVRLSVVRVGLVYIKVSFVVVSSWRTLQTLVLPNNLYNTILLSFITLLNKTVLLKGRVTA